MNESNKSKARRARLARMERIDALRACLIMGFDQGVLWHNRGYHSAAYSRQKAYNASWAMNSICMCNHCVVQLARARGIPFNN